MKVFISFSGDRSRAIAQALAAWLPRVLQAVRPFCSENDVAKGARWAHEISKSLAEATVGIICVTADNQSNPWLNFEAGALSNRFDSAHVCPLLFGITKGALGWPLGGFQAAEFGEEEIRKLLRTINTRLKEFDKDVSPEVLEEAVTTRWPQLESEVAAALERASPPVPPRRSEVEMLEELLTLTRGVFATMAADREQRSARDNRFLRALQPIDPLVESVADFIRSHPDPSLAGYRTLASGFGGQNVLKTVGGDFRLSGGDAELTKSPARNPLLPDERTE